LNVVENTYISGSLNQTNSNQSNVFLGGVGIGTTDLNSYKLNVAGSVNVLSLLSNSIPIDFNSYVTTNQLYGKVERQYPPKIYDTSSYSLTSINGLNNVSTETISISSGEYGAGNYTIYTTDTQQNKKFLFNYVINDDNSGTWGNNYAPNSGIYNGTTNSINNYYGDWIIIKLPAALVLSRLRIYPFLNSFSRNPSLWKCFGSNDGSIFIEITYASNNTNGLSASDYSNGYYEKLIPELFVASYLYIAFVFNKLIGGDANSISLAMVEFQIFGRDQSPSVLYITSLFNKNLLYYSTTGNDPNYLKISSGGIVNSNLTVLGKIAIGTSDNQTSNLFISDNANAAILGNVGIGTNNTSTHKLNVLGNTNISGDTIVSGSLNQTNLNKSNIFMGNVGIGTTNPGTYQLNVFNGNTNLGGNIDIFGSLIQKTSSQSNIFLGKVGIGTTNTETYNLNINGSINASNIYEKGILITTKINDTEIRSCNFTNANSNILLSTINTTSNLLRGVINTNDGIINNKYNFKFIKRSNKYK